MINKIHNPPTPKVLINSIRQIGYSFESAIADIIDNSISACSKNINIYLPVKTDENPYIAFVDDGKGMCRDEAINAMKIGSDFSGERNENDLGRFGLGLKSASFSQCRKLTVVSKTENGTVAFGWDINEIERTNDWNCYEFLKEDIEMIPKIDRIHKLRNGTLIVWQEFDLIESKLDENTDLRRQLSRNMELAEKYVSLVFHRYLNKKTKIYINNGLIKGLDPFLENHPKTEKSRISEIRVEASNGKMHNIAIQPCTLPHYSDLTEKDIALLGGSDRIRDDQGFYIYRQDRLINYGTWFKIKVKNEPAKYARIKVDIPNTLDDIWSIDVKKQEAYIPKKLIVHFKKSIEDIIHRSEKKINYKITPIDMNNNWIWNKNVSRDGNCCYFINPDSEYIKDFLYRNVEEKEHQKIYRLLQIIGDAIPIDDIRNLLLNNKMTANNDEDSERIVIDAAIEMINRVADVNKIAIWESMKRVTKIEPFNRKEIIEKIKKAIKNEQR